MFVKRKKNLEIECFAQKKNYIVYENVWKFKKIVRNIEWGYWKRK